MLQTRQPVLQRFWNPVIPSADVANKPVGLKYFGQDIVLWRDSTGAISALEDRCQHRTARLSAGWVDGDALVCGYHGWNYATDGKCIKIPQQPELAPKVCGARARARRFHAEDRYGYVWVCLAAEPLTGIPEFEEDGAPGFRRIPQFYEV